MAEYTSNGVTNSDNAERAKPIAPHLAAELLLQLSYEPGVDLLKALPQAIGHMDNDGLAAAGHVDLPAQNE